MKQRRRKGVLVTWWRPRVESRQEIPGFTPRRMFACYVARSGLQAAEIALKLKAKGRTGIDVAYGFGSAIPDDPTPTDDRISACGDLVTSPFDGLLFGSCPCGRPHP